MSRIFFFVDSGILRCQMVYFVKKFFRLDSVSFYRWEQFAEVESDRTARDFSQDKNPLFLPSKYKADSAFEPPIGTSPPRSIKFLDHFFIFQKNSLHLKMANFSSLKRRSIFTSRKILREKLELHSTSKKSLNIAKMEHFEAFWNFSLRLKTANFSSLKWAAISSSRKILREITRTRTASKLSVLAYNLLQLYPYKRTTVKRTRQSTV